LLLVLISFCVSTPTTENYKRIVRVNGKEVVANLNSDARLGWKFQTEDGSPNADEIEMFDVFYCGYYEAAILEGESEGPVMKGKFITLAYEVPGKEFIATHVKKPPEFTDLDVAANRLTRKVEAHRDPKTNVRYLDIKGVGKEDDDVTISCKINYRYRMNGEIFQTESIEGGTTKLIVNIPEYITSPEGDAGAVSFWRPFGTGWIIVGSAIFVVFIIIGVAIKVCGCGKKKKGYKKVSSDDDVESGKGKHTLPDGTVIHKKEIKKDGKKTTIWVKKVKGKDGKVKDVKVPTPKGLSKKMSLKDGKQVKVKKDGSVVMKKKKSGKRKKK